MRPLYPIPDRHGNYTPAQIAECRRVDAWLASKRKAEREFWRRVRMQAASTIGIVAAIGLGICLLVVLTGCEQAPIQVEHKAEVNHKLPDKIDINIRFPDRKPRNSPRR